MAASSLDSREKIISSYESGQNNLQNLEKLGAMILHGVDATTMNKLEIIKERRFDRIIFNFPHAGFFWNEKDNRVIKKHRHLLNMFFKNGMTMLNKMGEIHVTHKEQDPYDKWKLVEEAEKCGLVLKESVEFDKADYPGYTNRRGAGSRIGETFFLGECRTYMFILSSNDHIHSAQPKMSLQGHLQILKAAILELESESQNRKAAETTKAKLDSSCNELRTVADKALKERDESRALRKKAKITKQKEKIARELGEALRLQEECKANLEFSFNELRPVIDETLKNVLFDELMKFTDETFKERDEFKRQKDEALLEKENITKQLAEILRLKEDVVKQRDVSIRKLEFERKTRIDAESANNELRSVLEKTSKERDGFRNKKDEVLGEQENIAKQLTEALRFKEDVVKEKAEEKKFSFLLLFLCIFIYFYYYHWKIS
ncbi:uncharacterized protein LOC131050897 [Cryptomeria japonica]|uniref:uncharacterized protein LOC131050897 n=1 Tax=Cryptomeria japonica TaxID=3369 RepID=UPI0027DA4429|nr:uncharacterized protein LOC131050897 [Cryptomeria japonica]